MIFNRNKHVVHLIALLILASCSTTSNKLFINTDKSNAGDYEKDIQEMYDYKNFFINDLEILRDTIDSQNLNQSQLRNIKLLQKNYQKILSKNKYLLVLNPRQKYSKKLIDLIYQLNLPIDLSWKEEKQIVLPEDLLSRQIEGFCSSLYDDSISSIIKEINKIPSSTLVIYSPGHASFVEALKSVNSKILITKYNSSNFQEFAAEILGINFSKIRFNKISNLNPNQKINFTTRSRSDVRQVILLLEPEEYKAMIPALRYHGGKKFKYINFISSLKDLNDPLQLLDYEDSYTPISIFFSRKIKKDSSESIENFLEYGILGDWLLTQVLKQANVQSAKINGATGIIIYKSNSCTKREIPMQKISSNLFSI